MTYKPITLDRFLADMREIKDTGGEIVVDFTIDKDTESIIMKPAGLSMWYRIRGGIEDWTGASVPILIIEKSEG